MNNIGINTKKIAKWFLIVCLLTGIFNSVLTNEKPLLAIKDGKCYIPAINELVNDVLPVQLPTHYEKDHDDTTGLIINTPYPYSYDYLDQKEYILIPPLSRGSKGVHILGTDGLGRDVFAGVLRGLYTAFKIALLSLFFAIIIGVSMGIIMGYYGNKGLRANWVQIIIGLVGVFLCTFYIIYPMQTLEVTIPIAIIAFGIWLIIITSTIPFRKLAIPIDTILLKIIEILKSIPTLILLLVLLPMIAIKSSTSVILILSLIGWKNFARHSRAETYEIKTKEYIDSARVLGLSDFRIMKNHILPNLLPTVLVVASLSFSSMVILESTLAFLGLGVSIEEVSWGSLLAQGRTNIGAWWLAAFPGILLFLVVLSANILVDHKLDLDDKA